MKHHAISLFWTLLLCLVAPLAHAGSITYTYDTTGRLTAADYGSGRSIAYTYDNNGNLLQRTVQGAVTTYTLTVNNGTGGGEYKAGTVVNISANAPAAGKVFAVWTGDTARVADVTRAATTVTMPENLITVTATYRDQEIAYVSADGCGDNNPCYSTLSEAVSSVESDTLIKVAGNLSADTNVDAGKTLYIEFGYDADFNDNKGGVTEIKGTFIAKDKTVIRSGIIRAK